MKATSRRVLVRDAAEQLRQAACKGQQDLWDRCERKHAEALTPAAAGAAVRPLLQLCEQCPVAWSGACARWAEVDAYTGIAAGTAWVNGRPRSVNEPPALDNLPRAKTG